MAYLRPDIYRLANTLLKGRLRNYAEPSVMHQCYNRAFLHSENNVAIEWFREAGKSTSIWGLTAVHNALFGFYDYIAYIGESQDKADGYLNSYCRSYIEDTEAMYPFIKDVYYKQGELRIVNWNDQKILYRCLGSGKSPRGLSEGSIRPNLVILDDITTTEQGESQGGEAMKKQNSWYFSDIDPLASDAKFICAGTCVHELCLSHQLATNPPTGNPEAGVRNWEGYVFGVVETDSNGSPMWDKPVWPERRSVEWIRAKKEQFASSDQIGKFYTEYMNMPVADEERYFGNIHKLEYATDTQIREATQGKDFFIVIDPAPSDKNSKKRGRDYTVILVGCKIKDVYWIVDGVRFREDLEYQINKVFEVWSKWQPQTVWIEDFGAQTYLLQALQMEARRRSIWMSIRGTKEMELNHKGKHPRIQNLKPIIAEKKLVLPLNNSVLSDVLKEELYMYPKGKHDDVADAVSYFPLILKGGDFGEMDYNDLVGPGALI